MEFIKLRSITVAFFLVFLSIPAIGEQVQLVSGPALTPDGTTIYFSWRGDLWSAAIGGGQIQRVTEDSATETSPVVSADGKTIYYASNRTGAYQVYRMELPRARPTQLTFHSEGSQPIGVSGDGETVYTIAQRDAWWRWATRFHSISSKHPRSGERQLFDAYGSAGVVTPDGQRVLFSREGMNWSRKQYKGSRAGQIWLWDKKTGDYTKVIGEDNYDARYPIWDPDGKGFYYVSEEDGTKNLWSFDLESGRRKQLTQFEDDGVISPAISSDGNTIVFRRLFDLYKYNPKRNKPPQKLELTYQGDLFLEDEMERTLTKARQASFSQSGTTVAFIAGGDVWLMDTTLREPVQVTDTIFFETEVLFDQKRDRLLFVSAIEDKVDIFQATRSNPDLPWWRNTSFEISQLTDDVAVESQLALSPQSRYLTFVKHRKGLWIWDLENSESSPEAIVNTWSNISYDWSPAETWITYAVADNNFNYDVHLVNVNDPKKSYNVSQHPDNEYNPVWSPDGKTLAFVGRRFDHEYDIYYVSLTRARDERTQRDEKLEKALNITEKSQEVNDDPSQTPNAAANQPATDPPPEYPALLETDLEGISQRIRKVSIPSATETELVWSPDSKLLAFQAEIDGKQGVYTITPYETTTPTFMLDAKAEIIDWRKEGNKMFWLKDGVPGWAAEGDEETYPFDITQTLSRPAYHREIFVECWRIMRDDFYDGNFNNRNWDEIRRKYIDIAEGTVTKAALSRVVALMLGELNASHLGYRGSLDPSDPSPTLSDKARTGHLGVFFDEKYKGPGLKVKEVIEGSPAAAIKSEVLVGDVILKINGTDVDPAMDVTEYMNGTVEQDTTCLIERDEKELTIILRPITYASLRALLYTRWISFNQDLVESRSRGTLGYLHIKAMDMSSFHRFERELYEVAADKSGIIIDVRENGGGFTTDHLLTILTQPRHAITKPRGGGEGYPQDRSIYATWSKPIIVLCNQNSHSNAEIFSHAIKHLGRGRLVGVPTSGSVISTGSRSVMDAGSIRIPFRGWYLLSDGQDMELNGAVPNHIIWPVPGAIPNGMDKQLNKAIALLNKDVARANKIEKPTLIKASEREGRESE